MTKKNYNPLSFSDLLCRDIRLSKQRHEAISAYYWDHYCYFAHQRSLIFEELKQSLAAHSQSLEFTGWQRVISYQFSLNPLSAKGSVINEVGGRFNIGDINVTKFPQFAALYIAEDRETAYKERFGLYPSELISGLTPNDLALTSSESTTIVVLNGIVKNIFNLCDINYLKAFFFLIKNIKLPTHFIKRARKLNMVPSCQVKNLKELYDSLLHPDWRQYPQFMDIPAQSQIFGQIANAAGIEAILYPSKISKKRCLAIFPNNFAKSLSYVQIEDKVPNEVISRRLDAQSYLHLL